MKYWMLMALRTMARVGLVAAVVCWCLPASEQLIAGCHYRRTLAAITVHHHGWSFVRVINVSGSANWWLGAREITDLADWENSFSDTVTDERQIIPGAYYHSSTRHGENLFVAHWLMCLTLLIATIATSVKWRQPAESVQDQADE